MRQLMTPTPQRKTVQISPILISDKVTLHVSREKDGKLRFVYAGWDDANVVQAGGCGQARTGVEGRILPSGRGSDDPPPAKTRTPSDPPPFHQPEVALTCIEPCIFFSLVF
jgi:hypothetical protein